MNKFTELFYRIIFMLIPDRTIRGSYRFLFIHKGFKNAIKIIKETKARSKEKRNHKYYLSIVAAVKNEDLYLKEWIEYNKLIGVEHFYIYDNESTDNSKQVLEPYIDEGLVTYIYYPGGKVQVDIYNDAIEKFEQESKWFAYIDIDEYIKVKPDLNLPKYLKTKEQYNQVTFQWIIFGDSHHKTHQDGLIIENYTLREKAVCETMKSIVQPQQTMFALVHKHSVLGKSLNADISEIQCNHYYCKSIEDFKNKKSARKSFGGRQAYDMECFNRYNKNEIQEKYDDSFIELLKEKVAK